MNGAVIVIDGKMTAEQIASILAQMVQPADAFLVITVAGGTASMFSTFGGPEETARVMRAALDQLSNGGDTAH